MLGRVPMVDVRSLAHAVTYVESGDRDQVLICDVDNTLVPQGVTLDEFAIIVNEAIDRLEAVDHVATVIPLTNGPQRGVDRVIGGGNKPWTTRRRLGLRGDRSSITVIGDQVLTDGALAWRLGATFLYLVIDDEREDRRQATMRRVGRAVTRLFFRRAG